MAQAAGGALSLAGTLIVGEPEQAVLKGGPAYGIAELIAFEGRPFIVEEVPRIKFIVAQELEAGPVDLIGPRFGDQINSRTTVLAKNRGEGLRLNLEF